MTVDLADYLDELLSRERDRSDPIDIGDIAVDVARQRRLAREIHAQIDALRFPWDPEHDPHATERSDEERMISRLLREERLERRRLPLALRVGT